MYLDPCIRRVCPDRSSLYILFSLPSISSARPDPSIAPFRKAPAILASSLLCNRAALASATRPFSKRFHEDRRGAL